MIHKLTRTIVRTFAFALTLCATSAWAATAKTNPVTGETESYDNVFTGGTAEWNNSSNWDTTTTPFITTTYSPALVDGKTASTSTKIDGWTLRVGAYNGASVTWSGGINKIQAGTAGCWLTADDTSKITIASFAGNQLEGSDTYPFKLTSANAGGITWSEGLTSTSSGAGQRIPFWYYLKGEGTVVYNGDITIANAQVIKMAEATLSYPAEKTLKRKKLVSFASATVRFKTADSTVVKIGPSTVYFTGGDVPTATSLTTDSPVGACEIVQLPNDTEDEDGPGVYLYYVDGKPKTISINFGQGYASIGNNEEVGLVPVSGWLNTDDAGSGTTYPETALSSLALSDSEGTSYAGMKLYLCSRGGNYGNKGDTSTAIAKLLRGFMDNNNFDPNKNAGIKITGMHDFASRYSVYVYFSRDSAAGTTSAFPSYYINGIPYYGDGSKTVPGYQVWGTVKTHSLEDGVNTLIVHGLSEDTLVVAQPNNAGGRGCIAGIQIVADSESGLETPIKYVSVTAPSSDWDSLSLPTTARGIDVTTSTIDFGSTTPTGYYQLLGSRQAIVADITSGTITEAATLQTEANNKSCGDVDLYLLINGGTVTRAIGILNQDWGSSNGSQSGGNAMVQIGGNATVAYAYGAGYEGNGGTAPGSTGVTIKDNATLTGSAFGGWASQHNANPTVSGNTSVKVLNIQKTNTAAADSTISNNAIVGGSGYRSNGSSRATINGSSSVTVDLSGIAAGADTFNKKIIGGCAQLVNNATTSGSWTIGGDSSVTITAGNDITFGQDIVGGSYVASSRTATMTVTGNSSVTLNGGNYTSRTITAGGSGNGTSSGSATLTINGGIFTSATLAAGNATGAKKLVLNQAVDPTETTISGFTELEVGDGVTQANISALTGLSSTTVGTGAEYTTSAGDEGTVLLLNGGTLKLTVTAAQITSGYTPTIDSASAGTIRYFDGEGTELTADVFNNVLLPEGDGSKPYTFELDGDMTYKVVSSSTFANGIIVTGSGTLTIESDSSGALETTTVSLEDGANLTIKNTALVADEFTAEESTQILAIDETTTFDPAPTFTTVKVQGSGTVVYTLGTSSDYVASEQKPFTDSGWTGTVELKDCYLKNIDFAHYGNTASKVRANGVRGYLMYSSENNEVANVKTLEIAGTGLLLNNGLHSKRFIFTADITGSGQFDCGTSSGSGNIAQYIFKGDVNGFEGGLRFYKDGSALTDVAPMIYILTSDADNPDFSAHSSGADHGRIFIGAGASATIASGKTWGTPNVENKCSWTVNGTLTVKGTIYGGSGTGSQGRVKGSGTVIFDGKFPSGSEYGTAWWNGSDWSGTLEIHDATTETAFYLTQLGSSESTVKFNGFTGPMASGSNAIKQLEIGTSGWTLNGTFAPTIPAKVIGSGTFTVATTGDSEKTISFTGNTSEFAGLITFADSAAKSRVLIGSSTSRTFAHKSVVIGANGVFNVKTNWWPSGSVCIDETGVFNVNLSGYVATGYGIIIDGTVSLYRVGYNFANCGSVGTGTSITVNSTGLLVINNVADVNDTDLNFSVVTGTGKIRYASVDKWRSLPYGYPFATTLEVENELGNGLLLATPSVTYSIGSLSGTKGIRSDYISGTRNLTINQAKNTTWSGVFIEDDRLGTVTVQGGSTTGTLTLSGTQTHTNALSVAGTGSVNLTGTWKGNTTVSGTFGGTGSIAGALTLNAGSTFKVWATGGLTVTGALTLPASEKVTVDVSDLTIGAGDSTTLLTVDSGMPANVNKFALDSDTHMLSVSGQTLSLVPIAATLTTSDDTVVPFKTVQEAVNATINPLYDGYKYITVNVDDTTVNAVDMTLKIKYGAGVSSLTVNSPLEEYTSDGGITDEESGITTYSLAPAATIYTWSATGEGVKNWTNPANWTYGSGTLATRCPTDIDSVVFNDGASVSCSAASVSCKGMTIYGNVTLAGANGNDINLGGNITGSGVLTLDNACLKNSLAEAITVENTVEVHFTKDSEIAASQSFGIRFNGPVSISGTIKAWDAVHTVAGTTTLSGDFTKSGGGFKLTLGNVVVSASTTPNISAGTLAINGSVTVSDGATFTIPASGLTVGNSASFVLSGRSSVLVDNGSDASGKVSTSMTDGARVVSTTAAGVTTYKVGYGTIFSVY